MSNNKQSMKLYTHEEIVNFLKKEFADEINAETFMENLTPIELPSDSLCINCDESKSTHNVCIDCMIKIGKENIELPSDEDIRKWAEMQSLGEPTGAEEFGRIYGAKWMRDLIQGGNK